MINNDLYFTFINKTTILLRCINYQKCISILFKSKLDLNSNLLFSINDLQKLGFMMYYHYCF